MNRFFTSLIHCHSEFKIPSFCYFRDGSHFFPLLTAFFFSSFLTVNQGPAQSALLLYMAFRTSGSIPAKFFIFFPVRVIFLVSLFWSRDKQFVLFFCWFFLNLFPPPLIRSGSTRTVFPLCDEREPPAGALFFFRYLKRSRPDLTYGPRLYVNIFQYDWALLVNFGRVFS